MPRGFFVSRGVALHAMDKLFERCGAPTRGFRFHESLRNPRLNHRSDADSFPLLREGVRIWAAKDVTAPAAKELFGKGIPVGDELAFVADDHGLIALMAVIPRALYEGLKTGRSMGQFYKGNHQAIMYEEVRWAARRWSTSVFTDQAVDHPLIAEWMKTGLERAGDTLSTTAGVDTRLAEGTTPGEAASMTAARVQSVTNPLFQASGAGRPPAPADAAAVLRAAERARWGL